MLPEIPNFNLGDVYILTGKTLDKIVQRIRMQTPIAGENLRAEETNNGILLHADQAVESSPTISKAPPVTPPEAKLASASEATLVPTVDLNVTAPRKG